MSRERKVFSASAAGHVAGYDALGQAFGDGGLPYPGLADEDGIVLGAAREHLDDPADLGVPADDRIQFAPPRQFGEVATVARERLVAVLRGLVGDPVAAADRRQRLQHALLGGARRAQDFARVVLLDGEPQQEVLGRHVVVAEFRGVSLGRRERTGEIAADARIRSSRDAAELVECGLHPLAHQGGGNADLVQDRRDDSLFLAEEHVEEVDAVDFRALAPRGVHDGPPQRLGRLHRQTVDFDHLMFPLSPATPALSGHARLCLPFWQIHAAESAILADFDGETPLTPPAHRLPGRPPS